MLDDLKYIHHRDGSDALGIAEKQWQQLTYEFTIEGDQSRLTSINKVIFAGMGGSALAALLSTSWPGYSLPFEICRNYDIPSYVDENSLFIASSYSGNTEETLTALYQAEGTGTKIAVITSGGKLADWAQGKQYPLLILPDGFQPRHAVLYSYKALMTLLQAANINNDANSELAGTSEFVKNSVKTWRPNVATKDNQAKLLALEIMGKSPVIYAGPKLFPAAYKWKISFNENAKNIAWCNQLPEFNHNEFLGWVSHPTHKPYGVIDLLSSFEHERVRKRFEVTEKLLSGKRPASHDIEAEGSTLIEQLLWTVALGDFVSIYLALLNGLDPTPVELIEKFKKELG